MELWELIARERVRDSLARYTWSADALRLDDLVGAFCEDGELEIRHREPLRGRDAIRSFFSGSFGPDDGPPERTNPDARPGPSVVRHNVTNIRFLEVHTDQARVACYFTVVTDIGLDHCGRYRDTLVPVGDEWLIRHRLVSTDWRAPDSLMARPTDL